MWAFDRRVRCAQRSARLGRDSAKKVRWKKVRFFAGGAEDDLLTEQILYPVAFGFDRTAYSKSSIGG
jgi:hypothetical protein